MVNFYRQKHKVFISYYHQDDQYYKNYIDNRLSENIINKWIHEKLEVHTDVMDIEQAKLTGATALFGEKYGDTVRVVNIGYEPCISKEFCAGTHASNTSDLRLMSPPTTSSSRRADRRQCSSHSCRVSIRATRLSSLSQPMPTTWRLPSRQEPRFAP